MSRLQPLSGAILRRIRVSPSVLPQRLPVRHFSADHHHGPPKVNFWEDFRHPGNWKEEQFVLISLAGWGLLVYGIMKAVPSKKSPEQGVEQAKADH